MINLKQISLIISSLLILSACSIQATLPTTTQQPIQQQSQCRQNALAGVYHPSRLEIKEPCKTVSGTVETVKKESDGDYHIALKLDTEYSNLVNEGNIKNQHGNLVVEVIPLDQHNISKPRKNEHITVTGVYVLDKHHEWMEVHPAWIVNGQGDVNYNMNEAKKLEQQETDD